jgi:stearoyl-CoA desaturase (delta-9 desaturase)
VLEILGLAEVRRRAPKTSFEMTEHRVVDIDMLKAVIANRFHVLKLYGSRVVRPVVRSQSHGVSGEALRRLQRVRKLLVSEAAALDVKAAARLREALESNQTLRTIYEFKQRLKALWNHHHREPSDPLAKLQTWCVDAEASGIASLQEFARQLRGYRSQLA